ncbi:hypothetical protein HanHA300_Chr11g0411721 [Helianthus annuus]|nr:hypothetical protein HanHA300_Chr11g0411721 [Helianthus annuus]KAJ0686285.1 hypothetical protein HanLR1_Chr11g0413041 [Helianthus annuus]
MSGHCTVDEFSSLRNDRAWYNLTFVMVELIWHDVEGKRLVIIFLDQNRQKIVAIVPQDLIHLYNDDTLMGGFFSLYHFQIENLNYHEYPKYHNYLLVCSEKKSSSMNIRSFYHWSLRFQEVLVYIRWCLPL